MMKMVEPSAAPEVTIFSDVSGNWGCGVIWDTHWLQWEWDVLGDSNKSTLGGHTTAYVQW